MIFIIIRTFIIGLVGGWIFHLFHLPLAWMLGSMTAVYFTSKWTNLQFVWPSFFRNFGLIVIGYAIGHSFSKETIIEIGSQLPSMLAMTLSVILFSVFLAFILSKLTGINIQSTLIGSIPGGLSQMIVLGEEVKGVDLTVVTIIQVIRLISVIIVVPFLIFSPLLYGSAAGTVAGGGGSLAFDFHLMMVVFLIVAWLSAVVAERLHFPTPFLLGPILGVGTFMVFDFSVPILPDVLLLISQLFLGIHFSFMLKFKGQNAKSLSKFIGLAIVTSIMLLVFSLGLGAVLMLWHDIPFLTAFVSMAPGGMAEMALVGQAIKADLSIITAYHLFRILFILFIVPLCLRWLFKLPYFTKKLQNSM